MNTPQPQAVAPTATATLTADTPAGNAAPSKSTPTVKASTPPKTPAKARKPKTVKTPKASKPKATAKPKAVSKPKATPSKKVMASTDANHQEWQELKRELVAVMSDILYDSRRVNPDYSKSQDEAAAKVKAALTALTEFAKSVRVK